MILGIGIDMIEVSRVERACKKERFLKKYFTADEIDCVRQNPVSLAGNFAVKEAVAKVLGTGFLQFGPDSIEVLRDSLGKPYVNLYGKAAKAAAGLGIRTIHVSITNTKEMAAAVAVGEGEPI